MWQRNIKFDSPSHKIRNLTSNLSQIILKWSFWVECPINLVKNFRCTSCILWMWSNERNTFDIFKFSEIKSVMYLSIKNVRYIKYVYVSFSLSQGTCSCILIGPQKYLDVPKYLSTVQSLNKIGNIEQKWPTHITFDWKQ